MKKIENIVIAVLAVAVVGLAYLNFGSVGKVLSADVAAKNAISFINSNLLEPGMEAELVGDVEKERGLYKIKLKIGDQEISSYVTEDGTMLFPQEGIDLTDSAEGDTQSSPENSPQVSAPTYDENSHIRGELDAPVTIVEFSDFQCSFCARFHDTMKQVVENYPTQVKWVYRHFPLDSRHPMARGAAEASECASDQDKFWEYTDGLYAGQSEINSGFLLKLAVQLKLDTEEFDECLSSGKYADIVEADYQDGIASGVTGTPGSFINGELLGGAVPFETLKSKIDGILGE